MQGQTQAAGAGGAKSGGGESILQNQKVQIAIIAVAAVVILTVVYFMFFNNTQTVVAPVVNSNAPMGVGSNGPTTMASGAGGNGPGSPAPVAVTPGAMAGNGPAAFGAPGSGPGAPGAPAGAPGGKPGAAKEASNAPAAPGVSTRKNPFVENDEMKKVEGSVPIKLPPPELAVVAPALDVYGELNPPKPVKLDTNLENAFEPPIPPMRLAGVIYGDRSISATFQLGEQFLQIVPGKMIPEGNPVYRIDRIDQDRVFLSRHWENGGHQGTQHVEVNLQGSMNGAGTAAAYGGGFNRGMGNGPGGMRGMGNGPRND